MPGRVLTPQDCYALINQISEEVQALCEKFPIYED